MNPFWGKCLCLKPDPKNSFLEAQSHTSLVVEFEAMWQVVGGDIFERWGPCQPLPSTPPRQLPACPTFGQARGPFPGQIHLGGGQVQPSWVGWLLPEFSKSYLATHPLSSTSSTEHVIVWKNTDLEPDRLGWSSSSPVGHGVAWLWVHPFTSLSLGTPHLQPRVNHSNLARWGWAHSRCSISSKHWFKENVNSFLDKSHWTLWLGNLK